MSKRVSKKVLRAAKAARENSFKEDLMALEEKLNDLYDNDGYGTSEAQEILNNIEQLREDYNGPQRDRRNSRSAAKAAMREAKASMPNRNRKGRAQIQWVSTEARHEARGKAKKTTKLAQVEEVGLMKAHRKMGRWEMIDAPRDINRGEIMMIISETYDGYNKAPVVDAMCGADVFKGVPAKALRSVGEE